MATHGGGGRAGRRGRYDGMCAISALGVGARPCDAGAETVAGTLVEGAVTDDDIGHAGLDRERRLLDGGAGRPAAVVDAAEERQVADAEAAGDVDVGVGVRAERHHALHFRGGDAGLIERQRRRPRRRDGARSGPSPWRTPARRCRRWRCCPRTWACGIRPAPPARRRAGAAPPCRSRGRRGGLAPRMATVTVPLRPSSVSGPFSLTEPRQGHGAVGVVGGAEANAARRGGDSADRTSR